MLSKTLIRFAALVLVPALLVDPGFAAVAPSKNGSWHHFSKIVPGTIFVEQALEERGIPYLASEARVQKSQTAEGAQLSIRREAIPRNTRFKWARRVVNSSDGRVLGMVTALLLAPTLAELGRSATFESVMEIPGQMGIVVILAAVMGVAAIMLLIRHSLGKGSTDASHVTTRLSKAVYHFLAHPGSFYGVIAGTTVISEIINFYIYLHAPPSQDPHTFLAKQIFMLTIGIIFIVRILHFLLSSIWMIWMKPQPPPAPLTGQESDLPFVTVQIPIRNEPFDIVKMTLDSALAIDYPRDRIEIQVIDNSDRPDQYARAKAYAEAHGAIFIHRDGTEGFKAGNLNLGMRTARGSHFLVLDADSTVELAVLLKAMPEFRNNPLLGYVQLCITTTNESYNGITKIVAMGMRGYHRLYETLMNDQGFVKFDGHNGIITREALETIGGWQKEVSEDLATALKIRMAGYQSKYVPYVVTGEEAPTTFHELMKQQRKWSFGTTKILFEQAGTILRSKALSWFEKADILLQMAGYLTTALGFVLIFAYIQFPVMGAVIILVSPYVPLIIANWRHKRDLVGQFAFTTMVFSALMPTLFVGVFNYFIGRKEGFRITTKGGATNLGFFTLIRRNAFAFGSAILFFAFLPMVYPDIPGYIQQLPPSTIVMLSVLIAPVRLNYSKLLGGDARLVHAGWRNFRRLIRRVAFAVLLLAVSFGPFRSRPPSGPDEAGAKGHPIEFAVPDHSRNLVSIENAGWPRGYVNFRQHEKAVYWDMKKPVELKRGQVLRIEYSLKGSDVVGVQLVGVGQSDNDKGDMTVMVHAGHQQSFYVVVGSDLMMRRIAFQIGPNAGGPFGGSMDAGIGVRYVEIAPPQVSMPSSTSGGLFGRLTPFFRRHSGQRLVRAA